eukprot:3831751-Rhodomonas_salina.2
MRGILLSKSEAGAANGDPIESCGRGDTATREPQCWCDGVCGPDTAAGFPGSSWLSTGPQLDAAHWPRPGSACVEFVRAAQLSAGPGVAWASRTAIASASAEKLAEAESVGAAAPRRTPDAGPSLERARVEPGPTEKEAKGEISSKVCQALETLPRRRRLLQEPEPEWPGSLGRGTCNGRTVWSGRGGGVSKSSRIMASISARSWMPCASSGSWRISAHARS